MSKDKEESAGVGNAALFGEVKKKKGTILRHFSGKGPSRTTGT